MDVLMLLNENKNTKSKYSHVSNKKPHNTN